MTLGGWILQLQKKYIQRQKKPELFSRLVSSVPMVSDTVWERGKPFAHSPYMKDQLTFLPCS